MGRIDWSAINALPGAVAKPSRRGRIQKEPAPRKAVKPRNEERTAERRAQAFGPQAMACRRMPCAACGADAPSQAHHEPPRSVGGDDSRALPLCVHCHTRRHAQGVETFWAEVGLDVEDVLDGVRAWMESPARYTEKKNRGQR